jgi:hypothetical protein
VNQLVASEKIKRRPEHIHSKCALVCVSCDHEALDRLVMKK